MIYNSWFDCEVYRIYGCSSEPGGEIGVTGWWQQMVNDGSRIFLKKSRQGLSRLSERDGSPAYSGVPLNRAYTL